jgi:hypothetical protein
MRQQDYGIHCQVRSEICQAHLTSLKIIFRIGVVEKNVSAAHVNIKQCCLLLIITYFIYIICVCLRFIWSNLLLWSYLLSTWSYLFMWSYLLLIWSYLLFMCSYLFFTCSYLLFMCSFLLFICSYLIYLCLSV